jgi:predicted HTH domain antitoxin
LTITLNIPDGTEKVLREAWGSYLDRAALEALAIEGYRSRKFGISTVRRMLGFETRWEAQEWLGRRGVCWNYTAEDLDADRKTLEQALGPAER